MKALYQSQYKLIIFPTYFLVDGVWGMWSPISECSRTCGGGTKTRHRACDSPAASNGGVPCPGDVEEAHPCNTVPCPGMCNQSILSRRDLKCSECSRCMIVGFSISVILLQTVRARGTIRSPV